jgi:serine/threonine protein kinase
VTAAAKISAYSAPEMLSGDATPSGGWWSLGIILLELLTERNPFQRPDGSRLDEEEVAIRLASQDIDLSGVTDMNW